MFYNARVSNEIFITVEMNIIYTFRPKKPYDYFPVTKPFVKNDVTQLLIIFDTPFPDCHSFITKAVLLLSQNP
jgi:hypothetical protein